MLYVHHVLRLTLTTLKESRVEQHILLVTYIGTPGSVTDILSDLVWESLDQRRQKARATLTYKIKLVAVPQSSTLNWAHLIRDQGGFMRTLSRLSTTELII